MALPLNLALGPYDWMRPIKDGEVRVEGTDLNLISLEPEECFWRMIRFREFDAAELSLSSYVLRRSKGNHDFVAIPVFPSRFFRHSSIYVRRDAGIESPQDLKGRRVGVGEYQMTALVWVRGFLQDDYGVKPEDIEWHTGGMEQPGREEREPLELPERIVCRPIPSDETLIQALLRGDIDAIATPRVPSIWGHPNVARLFPDYGAVERDYYRRTGLFPIMHTVVIRKELLDANAWLADSLYKALVTSKAKTLAGLYEAPIHRYAMPFLMSNLEEQRALFGEDAWPFGFEPNRHALTTFLRYMLEQGLAHEAPAPETLFAPSSLSPFRI